MSGELKFISRLSKKKDATEDTAAPDEKEILHLSKKEAKKTFLHLAKKEIIHLSKRSTNSHSANVTILGQFKLPYKKIAMSQATGMTIRLSKKHKGAFHKANRELTSNSKIIIFKKFQTTDIFFQQEICKGEDFKNLNTTY